MFAPIAVQVTAEAEADYEAQGKTLNHQNSPARLESEHVDLNLLGSDVEDEFLARKRTRRAPVGGGEGQQVTLRLAHPGADAGSQSLCVVIESASTANEGSDETDPSRDLNQLIRARAEGLDAATSTRATAGGSGEEAFGRARGEVPVFLSLGQRMLPLDGDSAPHPIGMDIDIRDGYEEENDDDGSVISSNRATPPFPFRVLFSCGPNKENPVFTSVDHLCDKMLNHFAHEMAPGWTAIAKKSRKLKTTDWLPRVLQAPNTYARSRVDNT